MTVAVRTGLRQGTSEWLDARRALITSTDLSVLLGINPWKCEADLADEKLTGQRGETNLRMRMGSALEDLIADEYTAKTGRKVQRVRDLVVHPAIEWAGASPDRRVIGERRAVELKYTASRSRFADGIPQDVESQVVWTLGVLGWDVSDVAVLLGDEVQVFEVPADPALFDNLVVIATDFRRRLAEGGPFARDTARIKRDYPRDDGSEMAADADLTAAVKALVDTRTQRKRMQDTEEVLEDAIKARMGPVSRLIGDGFSVSWKKSKDGLRIDWKLVADGLLRQLPDEQREALVGLHSTVQEGARPFRVQLAKEDSE